MRCPYCERVSDIPDSEPVECEENEYILYQRIRTDLDRLEYSTNVGDYAPVNNLTEYQCRDCGKSFWV